MAHKKQPFRFRIPWLSGKSAARPATEPPPRRLKDRQKSPTEPEPDTNVPIQQLQSPPSPTKTLGPEKHSLSHPPQLKISSVIIESSLTSQLESPSRSTTPTEVNYPSPSLEPSSHAGSPKIQPQSPILSALDGPIMVSKLPAEESIQPTSSASEQEKEKMVMSEPILQEAETIQQQSPSYLALYGAAAVPMPAAKESSLPASSVYEQEKEIVVSEPMPQEVEPKINSRSKAIIKSQDTFSQPGNLSAQSTPILLEAPLETQSKSRETSSQPERMPTQPAGSEPQQSSYVPSSSPNSKIEPTASQTWSSSPLASERNNVLKPEDESTSFVSSVFEEENEKMTVTVEVSEPVLQETEAQMKSPSKIIPNPPGISSQLENLSIQPKTIFINEERSKEPKAPLETKRKLLQSEEKEKMVHRHHIKAGKAKDTTSGQPIRHTIASSSGTHAKDSFTRTFRADKKQHGERETVERNVMFATSNPSEKDIKVVNSADHETRNVSSISPERPVSSNEEKAPLQKGIKDDISEFVYKLATFHPSHPTDDKEFSVITLAGDNRGAIMHVGSDTANKEGPIRIHRAYKTDPEESAEVTTDGEENSNTKKKSQSSAKHVEVGETYVNSNIQSINNSLMFHGSVTERDPGVQVILPQKPADPIKYDDKLSPETHKTEFNISRVEKSNYKPMVRRRCLRGLFVEPSDSDPDNPDKPRRHGCKFSCDKNEKVEDIEDM
ncbi:PREDICTED: muscle M-line assembly protein unc-89-like isoform X2 [Lupinus angustifolius]|uniref:muscle M-line assembly protein unc-89-like isoform X2 n=1 Tax=Lupinus angustifolius TaxID=3871 RepID=UPI00092E3AFC|nr:PREDICTED: muscle M-line assembly protein unc-89-like isoform X2 [Lupinus angustifolius]